MTSDNARFSVITLTWNRPELVVQALSALRARTDWTNGQLVVVDQGSDRELRRWICDLGCQLPDFAFIGNPRNEGIPRGLNQGLRVATGSLLVIMGSDIEVPEGWLRELRRLHAFPEAGIAAIPCTDRLFVGPVETKRSIRACPGQAHTVNGMYSVLRATRQKLGYFCEEYGPYGEEDTDFAVRVECLGLQVVYSPELCVTHLGAGDDLFHSPEKQRGLIVRQLQRQRNCDGYRARTRSLRQSCFLEAPDDGG